MWIQTHSLTSLMQSPRTRAAAEVAFEFAAIFLYIWGVERHAPEWLRAVFFWGLVVAFPLFCIWAEQRGFPEFSLDWQDFLDCLRGLVWFTVAGTTVLIAWAIQADNFTYDGHFLSRVSEYFFWAFLQQIGFQTFLTSRVYKALDRPYLSALISSTLFALIHFPNPVLVAFTWVGGFFWCLSFIRTPNLYALAVSHGWLAVVALHCIPPAWLHGLRIGPSYWTF